MSFLPLRSLAAGGTVPESLPVRIQVTWFHSFLDKFSVLVRTAPAREPDGVRD
jgi:hypothetical protein